MTSTESVVQTRRREQWVDTLRVVLICGVIVVHTATAYVTDFAGYYYDDERVSDSAVSIATALPALMGGVFGLGPLFVVAGWFSARSLARRVGAGHGQTPRGRWGRAPPSSFVGGLGTVGQDAPGH